MSDMSVIAAGLETRQSMIRVWLALSAVWVAFWLLIAVIVVLSVESPSPFTEDLWAFAVIVLTPPLALLGLGLVGRLAFEVTRRAAPFRQGFDQG